MAEMMEVFDFPGREEVGERAAVHPRGRARDFLKNRVGFFSNRVSKMSGDFGMTPGTFPGASHIMPDPGIWGTWR